MWLGAVGGGVWKTTDAGCSWGTTTDLLLTNLAVDCMAMDPTNSNVLYAGTGETWYPHDGIQGDGIFKTSDGGTTWTQLSSTASNPDFYYVTRLAASFNSSLRTLYLLATTTTGLFRSFDGGTRWSRVMTGWYNTVVFRPDNPAYCLASRNGGDVFRSTDFGATWAQSVVDRTTGSPPPLEGRMELAYAKSSNGQIVYASACTASGSPQVIGGALFKSTDGGQHFLFTGVLLEHTLGYDGSYMNTLWVDPLNSSTVVVGGIMLYRSTDGGASKQLIDGGNRGSSHNAHSDHHVVLNHPGYDGGGNQTVFTGTDGGIYRTDNILAASASVNWTSFNDGLGITQFYGGAATSDGNTIIGGTQDNGTLMYQGSSESCGSSSWKYWTSIACSDGGMCTVGSQYFYGEIPTLQIFRTDGSYVVCAIPQGYILGKYPNNLQDAACGDECGNWAAPLLIDPNNANRLLAGGLSLWRSNNPSDPTPNNVSWRAIKPPVPTPTPGNYDKISAVAVAPGASDIIWVGHNSGALYFTTNGTADSPSWTQVSSPSLPHRYCGRIAFGPRPPFYDRVYVAFGGYSAGNLWKSADSGQTWTNISSGLPSAPITSIATRWNLGYNLYVGTAVGVFASTDDGQTWSRGIAGDVPANVFVDELFWTNTGRTLVAVTHGRGMFTANVQ